MSLMVVGLDLKGFFFFFFFFIFRAAPVDYEVSQSELQLLVHATATATPDPNSICDLHHSLWQGQILNPPSEARDRTHILTETTSGP